MDDKFKLIFSAEYFINGDKLQEDVKANDHGVAIRHVISAGGIVLNHGEMALRRVDAVATARAILKHFGEGLE